MKARLSILILFLVFFCFFLVKTHPCCSQPLSLLAKNEEPISQKEDSIKGPPPAIEEYEKAKLAKMKRNIGRRYLTVKKINPAEFYESPSESARRLNIKREKEGFVIQEVVQNSLGTMNFYQVKFDTGQIGYLSADGNYLEIKMKEGSLISAPRRAGPKKKSLARSNPHAVEAIDLVKNHPTPAGSVEKRMTNEKAKSFPFPTWRYEAKEIGGKKFRVLQYVEERSTLPFVRTWTVDLSTRKVMPENRAAKEMYQ